MFQITASLDAKHRQVIHGVDKVLPTKTRLSGDQVDQTSSSHVGAELAARSRRDRVGQALARDAEPQAGQCPRALMAEVHRLQRPGDDASNSERVHQSPGDLGRPREVVADRSLNAAERHWRAAVALTADRGDAVDRGRLNAGGGAVEVDGGEETVEEPRDAGDDVHVTACDVVM